MHYNFCGRAPGFLGQATDAAAENACRCAAPTGVKQGDASLRRNQVHRDTICDRHSEEDAWAVIRRADIVLRPYRCALCRKFHLTSRTKGKRIRPPANGTPQDPA